MVFQMGISVPGKLDRYIELVSPQDKVRAEVREVIGDGDLTLEHIPKLKYLEMVFKETVRLFPVGPVILREPHEDLEFSKLDRR